MNNIMQWVFIAALAFTSMAQWQALFENTRTDKQLIEGLRDTLVNFQSLQAIVGNQIQIPKLSDPDPEPPVTFDQPAPAPVLTFSMVESSSAPSTADNEFIIPPLSERKPGQVLKWVDP